jgi:hypothetical protein
MTVIKVCIVIWVTCAMQMFVYHEIGNDALMKWREKSVTLISGCCNSNRKNYSHIHKYSLADWVIIKQKRNKIKILSAH